MRFDPSLLPSDVPEGVYDPREDSLMLLDAITLDARWRTALEMGCGSGLASLHLAKAGLSVTAVDVNPEAVSYVEALALRHGLRIEGKVSDLFADVRGRYDLVVFNPPYLPAHMSDNCLTDDEKSCLVGGENGFELAMRFADEVAGHLDLEGAVYLLLLEEHGGRLQERRNPICWKLARRADFGGEMLAVFQGRPTSHK